MKIKIKPRPVKGGRFGRAPIGKPDKGAIGEIRELQKRTEKWGALRNAIFASEFLKIAGKHKANVARLVERTLRRVNRGDRDRILAIMKQMNHQKKR